MTETSFSALDTWTKSLDALTRNLKSLAKECKKDGTIGISRANVRQIISTNGVHVPPAQFDRLLDQAIERANLGNWITR